MRYCSARPTRTTTRLAGRRSWDGPSNQRQCSGAPGSAGNPLLRFLSIHGKICEPFQFTPPFLAVFMRPLLFVAGLCSFQAFSAEILFPPQRSVREIDRHDRRLSGKGPAALINHAGASRTQMRGIHADSQVVLSNVFVEPISATPQTFGPLIGAEGMQFREQSSGLHPTFTSQWQ